MRMKYLLRTVFHMRGHLVGAVRGPKLETQCPDLGTINGVCSTNRDSGQISGYFSKVICFRTAMRDFPACLPMFARTGSEKRK